MKLDIGMMRRLNPVEKEYYVGLVRVYNVVHVRALTTFQHTPFFTTKSNAVETRFECCEHRYLHQDDLN